MSIAFSQKPPEWKKRTTPKRFANTSSRRAVEAIPSRWRSCMQWPGRAGRRANPEQGAVLCGVQLPALQVCLSGKLRGEDRSFLTRKLSQDENRRVVPVARVAPRAARRLETSPSGRLRSRFRGSCRTGGRRAWRGSRRFRRCRPGSAGGAWGHSTRITKSSFGPWAPRTRIRSMSPVRLGPVMNDSMLGSRPACRSLA
jgi:hypothetical protein